MKCSRNFIPSFVLFMKLNELRLKQSSPVDKFIPWQIFMIQYWILTPATVTLLFHSFVTSLPISIMYHHQKSFVGCVKHMYIFRLKRDRMYIISVNCQSFHIFCYYFKFKVIELVFDRVPIVGLVWYASINSKFSLFVAHFVWIIILFPFHF